MGKNMIHARLKPDTHQWVKEEFPHGFIQEFVSECFENLRIMIEEGRMPAPREYARRATIFSTAELVKKQTETRREK